MPTKKILSEGNESHFYDDLSTICVIVVDLAKQNLQQLRHFEISGAKKRIKRTADSSSKNEKQQLPWTVVLTWLLYMRYLKSKINHEKYNGSFGNKKRVCI